MSPVEPQSVEQQIAQLRAAVVAQESLRPSLGDATVADVIAAIETKIASLCAETGDGRSLRSADGPDPAISSPEENLVWMQACLPPELAAKIRAQSQGIGERKQITVLCADLSSLIAVESLDHSSTLREALSAIANAVYQVEGCIVRFDGRSLMASFGTPLMHEDDPERALRAALGILQVVDQLDHGPRLSVRIGVNTGPVLTGSAGVESGSSYAPIGETVNTASRLENAAQPGQILLTRETHRFTQAAFDFIALDPIVVKGKREALPVFALQRAKSLPRKTRGLQGFAPAFVGRENELNQLRAATKKMQAGKGQVILISGEAGMGKSRLAREWRAEATAAGPTQWVESHAFSHTTTFPYAPIGDLFHRIGVMPEDGESAAAGLNTLVSQLWPDHPQARAILANLLGLPLSETEGVFLTGLSAENMHQQMLALFEAAIHQVAGTQPLWMVVEDLQWADVSTLELIETLIPLTQNLPFTLLATTRPILTSGEIPTRFLAAAREQCGEGFVQLDLARLPDEASLSMAEQLLGMPVLPAGLQHLVLTRAEGNPFFVEEMIRSLIERGALKRTGDGSDSWELAALVDHRAIPETLQGLLMVRLDRLSPECKGLAQQAAVIGRVFTAPLIHFLAGNLSIQTKAGLDQLEKAGLIFQSALLPEVEYNFYHALTQEAAYASLLAPRRRELHSQVGVAIESLYGEHLNEYLSIVGEHFLAGEAWDKAYEYLLQAGDRSARLFAHPEACLHYNHALIALGHFPETGETLRQRVKVLVKLDDASFLMGDTTQNLERVSEARQIMENLALHEPSNPQDRRLTGMVYLALARLYSIRNELAPAMLYTQQVLEIAEEIHDAEFGAIPSTLLGIIYALRGQFLRSEPLLRQSLDPLEKTGNWMYWIDVQVHLNLSLVVQGKFNEATQAGDQVLQRARQVQNLTWITQAECAFLIDQVVKREFLPALKSAERALQASEQSRDLILTSIVLHFRAWVESGLGQHAEAQESLAAAARINRAVGSQAFDVWHSALDAEIALNAGQVERGLELAGKAVELGEAAGNEFGAGLAHRVLGQALSQLDPPRWEEAQQQLVLGLGRLESSGGWVEAARTRRLLGQVSLACGDKPGAHARWQAAAAQFEAMGLDAELDEVQKLSRSL